MSIIDSDLLRENVRKYPRTSEAKLNYAVSGLRNKGAILDCPVFRTGLIAGLRSIEQNGSAIGVMITASHNPAHDNGVKIIDPRGEMLDRDWVHLATECINLPDDQLEAWLADRIKQFDLNGRPAATVFIAKDTRDSSVRLAAAASAGVRSVGGQFTDFGHLTTPQLHYIVNCHNTREAYGQASEEGYYLKYSGAFLGLLAKLKAADRYESALNIDCANGVGAPKMARLIQHLDGALKIDLINTGDGVLNLDCGADYVKIEQRAPKNFQLKPNEKFASFDGDADRLVYYYLDPDSDSFRLLDGDKIAALFAIYISDVLRRLHLIDGLDVSVVQTAYANGSSTKYIEQVLGMRTYCVATGVLNLHHKASQCDIGIYFEANGHGTILFGEKIISILKSLADDENAKELLLFVDLINQTAGDAISDLLATEFILRQLDWSIHQWAKIYTDLPQRQLKVQVKDRTKIKITEDERKCVEPVELQKAIDALVAKFGENARSFVRPSQTEDIVRVYAESNSQEDANRLAEQVAEKVRELVV